MDGHIMLLEDDPFLTDLIGLKCAAEQIGLKTVNSVDDAVKVLAEKDIRLAVMDVMLPEKSGVDAAAHIVDKELDMPFLFISGMNRGVFLEKYASQMDGKPSIKYAPYIMKPFNLNFLIKKIRETIDAHKAYAERNRRFRPVRKLA